MKGAKRLLLYTLYAIILLLTLVMTVGYEYHLKGLASRDFNDLPMIIYIGIYPVIIGGLLGLPKFIQSLNNEGILSVDYIKLTALGIPFFLVSQFILIYYFLAGFIHIPLSGFLVPFGYEIPMIGGIIFGYTVITSFQKQQKRYDQEEDENKKV